MTMILTILLEIMLFVVIVYVAHFVVYGYTKPQLLEEKINTALVDAELVKNQWLFCYNGLDCISIWKAMWVWPMKYNIRFDNKWTTVFAWTPLAKRIDKAFEELKEND